MSILIACVWCFYCYSFLLEGICWKDNIVLNCCSKLLCNYDQVKSFQEHPYKMFPMFLMFHVVKSWKRYMLLYGYKIILPGLVLFMWRM